MNDDVAIPRTVAELKDALAAQGKSEAAVVLLAGWQSRTSEGWIVREDPLDGFYVTYWERGVEMPPGVRFPSEAAAVGWLARQLLKPPVRRVTEVDGTHLDAADRPPSRVWLRLTVIAVGVLLALRAFAYVSAPFR